jgi:hypothetical protein
MELEMMLLYDNKGVIGEEGDIGEGNWWDWFVGFFCYLKNKVLGMV